MNRTRFYALMGLVIFGAALRLIPTGANVAPIGAIAIFCGLTFRNRWVAIATPLVATLVSDLCLASYNADFRTYLLSTQMLFVYGAWVLYPLCGFAVRAGYGRTEKLTRTSKTFARGGLLAGGSLLGSVMFFVITNFGSWVAAPTYYERSLAGLMKCYAAGVPFFHKTVVSDAACLGGLLVVGVVVRAMTTNATAPALVYAD